LRCRREACSAADVVEHLLVDPKMQHSSKCNSGATMVNS
jgi:hypothetical protein